MCCTIVFTRTNCQSVYAFMFRYLTMGGGVRIGRILEDMDIFAVHLVFKHVENPRQVCAIIIINY